MSKSLRFAPRERQILTLRVAGNAPKEIAAVLQIRVGTVNSRIFGIVTKAKLGSRYELVTWALAHPEYWREPTCPYCQAKLPHAA